MELRVATDCPVRRCLGDPGSTVFSAAQVLCCGRDEQQVARRAAAIGRQVDGLRANGPAGTPAEVAAKARRFGEVGATRLHPQTLALADLEHLELVATEVIPALA